MTESTPAIVTMLHGELAAVKRDPSKVKQVVEHTCKPVIRNLAKNYDEEDEKVKREKTAMAAKEAAMREKRVAAYQARKSGTGRSTQHCAVLPAQNPA